MSESGAKRDVDNLRFGFGKNWSRFLKYVTEERIEVAAESLRRLLKVSDLKGKSFLDIGSGSGLFSLAARRLGARVHSFDYDAASVSCTQELKRRYSPDDANWIVEQGSALDTRYLERLGTFDIVYSWGVLHHTGDMWSALANVAPLVAPRGTLYISIYNDQGLLSKYWTQVKRVYNASPVLLRPLFATAVMGTRESMGLALAVVRGRPGSYFRSFTQYSQLSGRGMSRFHDIIDWVGGYPFEVARPEQIFAFYRERNFVLESLKTCAGGIGCNEFVFRSDPSRPTVSTQSVQAS